MGESEFAFEWQFGSLTGDQWQGVEFLDPSPSSWSIAFGDTSAFTGGPAVRAGCSSGACPHPSAHPAETDWEQLASTVPVPGQLHRLKPRCEGMAYPTEDDFRSAVAAVRPEAADDHALQRLREAWTDEVAARLGEWPERIRSRLAGLADGWAGEDFDAFAAQTEQLRALVEGVLDDIDTTLGELRHREEVVYTLQGGDSGEIPYPAPMVGIEGEWSELVAIHVRPAWWHGDCITMTCQEAEKALELAGADPALATEVREFIEAKVGERLSGLGALVSEARLLAGEEARERYGSRVESELAAYQGRQAAIDEDIAAKRADQSGELRALQTAGSDRPYPAGADRAHMDLQAPEVRRPAAPAAPETREDPSPVPPGGDGSVVPGESEAEEADAAAWERAEDVDGEDASGGLAGGGGFGGGLVPGAPGGATPATVAATTASVTGAAGLFGGSTTPAPTTTAGGGSGPGRAGATGTAHGAPPSKGRGAAKDEETTEEDRRLTNRETGNVWGYVHPKNDPYA